MKNKNSPDGRGAAVVGVSIVVDVVGVSVVVVGSSIVILSKNKNPGLVFY
jgi:hypothetical protein